MVETAVQDSDGERLGAVVVHHTRDHVVPLQGPANHVELNQVQASDRRSGGEEHRDIDLQHPGRTLDHGEVRVTLPFASLDVLGPSAGLAHQATEGLLRHTAALSPVGDTAAELLRVHG